MYVLCAYVGYGDICSCLQLSAVQLCMQQLCIECYIYICYGRMAAAHMYILETRHCMLLCTMNVIHHKPHAHCICIVQYRGP